MSVWFPRVMAAQPAACAGVGAAKLLSNQARTAGEKAASASLGGAVAGARDVEATGDEYRPGALFRPDVRNRTGCSDAKTHLRLQFEVEPVWQRLLTPQLDGAILPH